MRWYLFFTLWLLCMAYTLIYPVVCLTSNTTLVFFGGPLWVMCVVGWYDFQKVVWNEEDAK